MKSLRLFAALAAAVVMTAPASAQQTMKLTTPYKTPPGPVLWNNIYVGPYQGMMLSRPGTPTIDIFCVDYVNSIHVGQTWKANFTIFSGDLSNTRFGALLGTGVAQDLYRQAAYLTEKMTIANKNNWGVIHAAIWHLFTPSNPNWTPSLASATAGLLADAAANFHSIDLNEWSVVTDVNTVDGQGGVQEFITHNVVPEPVTLLLMGTGLLAIVGAGLATRRIV